MYNLCDLAKTDNYWFTFNQFIGEDRIWSIWQDEDTLGDIIEKPDGSIEFTTEIINDCQYNVILDFELFKNRPEYQVYNINNLAEFDEFAYNQLILGCILIRDRRAGKPEDSSIERANKFIGWLQGTDFYVAPGSSVYHDNYARGLMQHSMRVARNILDVSKIDKFRLVPIDSGVLCALLHDLCKIGLYEPYYKNVKDNTGNWTQVQAYKRTVPKFPLGHGQSSLYIASKFFSLSIKEACAIRWHMGVWNCADPEFNDLQTANEMYPEVHMLQFADQLSIVSY